MLKSLIQQLKNGNSKVTNTANNEIDEGRPNADANHTKITQRINHSDVNTQNSSILLSNKELPKLSVDWSKINPLYPLFNNGDIILYEDVITDAEHKELYNFFVSLEEEALANNRARRTKSGRVIQLYGGEVTSHGLVEETVPLWFHQLSDKLHAIGLPSFDHRANHCLINHYPPNDGIFPHKDGPAYYPVVCILSLMSSVIFEFLKPANENDGTKRRFYVPKKSLLIFRGDLYENWTHTICPDNQTLETLGKLDYQPSNVPMVLDSVYNDRISVTLRFVPTLKNNDLFS